MTDDKYVTAPDGRKVRLDAVGEPFRGSLAWAMGRPMPDGIGEDVRLTVTTAHGPVLDIWLGAAGGMSRSVPRDLLPFVYRDPIDPEAPDEPRPLRRARLIVVNDGIVPEPEPEPEPGLYPYPLDALDPDGDPGDY